MSDLLTKPKALSKSKNLCFAHLQGDQANSGGYFHLGLA